jgi:hypothetical protein
MIGRHLATAALSMFEISQSIETAIILLDKANAGTGRPAAEVVPAFANNKSSHNSNTCRIMH